MYISTKLLNDYFTLDKGRLYHNGVDVKRNPEKMPSGFDNIPLETIAWVLLTGEQAQGKIHLADKELIQSFTPMNMIDTGSGKYATGAPVPQELWGMYEIQGGNFKPESIRPKNNVRLPTGVTELKNGKYRFKRKSRGLSRDIVSDSYDEILKIANEYEEVLNKAETLLKTKKSKMEIFKANNIDMKNIYQRGKQYYVEFMVRGNRLCILKTSDLQAAIKSRDDFLKERRSAEASVAQEERLMMLKIYEEYLFDGLKNLDYAKIKMAVNFLSQDEFDLVVENLEVIDLGQ